MMFLMKKATGGKGGGVFGVGKSNAKVYIQKETGVTFSPFLSLNQTNMNSLS